MIDSYEFRGVSLDKFLKSHYEKTFRVCNEQ